MTTNTGRSGKWAGGFFLAWILLNLVQAAGTELIADEAYYWVYAQQLDWGYFEQPPATAFLIWLGTHLANNELGVRWLFVLLSAGGLYSIWRLVEPQDQPLFFLLLSGIVMAHVGGFLAVPDIPLIFTSGLFYLLYKAYLKKDHWSIAIGLGMVVAAMSYSKYHAIILLASALAGSWWLIKRPSFWLIPLLAAALYIPHIMWQIANDFPPLQYHLIDRQAEPWTPMFAVNYLLGQLLVYGPFAGFLLFPAAFRNRDKDRLTHAMRWCAFGIFGFFLLLSLKGRVEANWTAAAIGPLLFLAYHYIEGRPAWRKWTFRLAIPGLLLIVFFRLYMLIDFLPREWVPRNEFHGWKEWAQTIGNTAATRPVIFLNNYQKTSRYRYYTGKEAHSISLAGYAGDQYDLLTGNEAALQGRPVIIMDSWMPATDTLFFSRSGPLKYLETKAFYSFNRLRFDLQERAYRFPADTLVYLPVRLSNPTDQAVDLTGPKPQDLRIKWHVFYYKKPVLSGLSMDQIPVEQLQPGEGITLQLPLRTPSEPGDYRFRFAIEWTNYSGRNGNFTKLKVE